VKQRTYEISGMTLTETMVSCAVSVVVLGGVVVGLIAFQRSFLASAHHARSQVAQLRLVDCIALDLRRALHVAARSDGGIDVDIPDYYESGSGVTPRQPRLVAGRVTYGTAPLRVSYYRRGESVYRLYNGIETEIATDVAGFDLNFPANLNQAVLRVTASFLPRYSLSGGKANRDGTSLSACILLRGRKNSL
jgi:hypothetical protein